MFGIDLAEAALSGAMLVAALAGLMSFISPCVLPIVPPYLAYMSGATIAEIEAGGGARRKAIGVSVCFVLGLSTVFLIMGAASSAFGGLFLQYKQVFSQAAGVVVIIFGLHFLHVFRIPLLEREARLDAGDRGGSALGAYVLGLAFAFGWTPCIGPFLGAILGIAAQQEQVTRGAILLGAYAFGLGIPFLLAAIFLDRAMGVMNNLKRHMGLVEKISGVLLLAVGILLLTGGFTALSLWLLETFPDLASVG